MIFKIDKIEEWDDLSEYIISILEYKVLLLKGDIGAGKTTFTKSLLKKLGSSDDVDSPTYALVNEYDTPRGKVFHFDLYRVNDVEELYDMGIEEYLDQAYLSIIEWPEIYINNLNQKYHTLYMERIGDQLRKIELS